jgi:CubicO group peptidase (beta-lactamase class C family)
MMSSIRLKQIIVTVFLVIVLSSCTAVDIRNPQTTWQQYETPEEAGFSSTKLNEAKKLYDSLDAAAFMVIYDGKVVVSWGDVERRFMCHSVRKSFLSALYGIHVDEGTIHLNKTLGELGIDDKWPLTKEEKQAVVKDLLKARSGVYHPAAYETAGMKALRPKRGSHKHNTFWYYNNWDFNVLCTILEKETGTDIFVSFKKRIADPLQMEDFRLIDGYHHLEPENSIHPAYPFRMSARDMARFGLLYLKKGKWNNKQIISKQWVRESTKSYSKADPGSDYGYLWWIWRDFKELGLYSALGVGAQIIAVIPGANMVIVQRVNTYEGKRVNPNPALFKMILDAKVSKPKPNPKLVPLQNKPSFKRPEIIKPEPAVMDKYVKEYPVGDAVMIVKKMNGHLILETPSTRKFKLLPVSETKFVMEDIEQYALFECDDTGIPVRVTLHRTSETADLYSDLMKQGVEAAIKQYKEKKQQDKNTYRFSEGELNDLGYQLLGMKNIKAAIEIFKLNVELYPNSFNVYDSLGEAYMLNKDSNQAIRNYKRSLELNPLNKNAEMKLKRLK